MFFFSIGVFFHYHSRMTGLQGKGEGISLTPHYHFHPLHRHLDIGLAITTESSPLHIGSKWTRTWNLWFLSASRSRQHGNLNNRVFVLFVIQTVVYRIVVSLHIVLIHFSSQLELCGICICNSINSLCNEKIFLMIEIVLLTYRGVFRTQSNIYDEAFWTKTTNDLQPLSVFAKKLHHLCLTGS